MFCPQCGTTQSEDLKFCNKCGANLFAVRQVVKTRETGETFDWNKTWVTEMFLSNSEKRRRREELARQRGVTPEITRYKEIKAGVITMSAGVGLTIFLYFLMQGIVLSGVDPKAAEILIRIWIAGVIPTLVGAGLIINGSFVSKKQLEAMRKRPTENENRRSPNSDAGAYEKPYLAPAAANAFIAPEISVVDDTTELLKVPTEKENRTTKSMDKGSF